MMTMYRGIFDILEGQRAIWETYKTTFKFDGLDGSTCPSTTFFVIARCDGILAQLIYAIKY